ncbi:MAG: tetratricopeptide repeat protein [Flavobacteriales bacterium]|nr:tetratricopeptide repeat protein [Flavobacteriales bacterium]
MRKNPSIGILTVALLFSMTSFAQKTATYVAPDRMYRDAVDLFDKEKYAAAQDKFEQYIADDPNEHSERSINAEYYAGLCAMYLFHKDAEYRLETFVADHPESPWVRQVFYELASYNYRRKRYKKALDWFEQTDPRVLPASKQTEFKFKRGHSYFEQEQLEAARQDFYEVKDTEGDFGVPSTYYYSHIVYKQGDYETALDGFKKLEKDPNFAPIVPYYITQILYKQGRYDEVLTYAPTFLDSSNVSNTKRLPEISRLIGDSYYRESQYEEAIPYLELYHNEINKKDKSREDFFQMGYCFYQTGKFQEALEYLNESSKEDDELGQSSIYHMADCYLKLDQKPYARTAFREASEMNHNFEIKEDALFNYAKLAFELSYNPFDEAITAFESYLVEYPESPRREEAYEFLLNVYMKTKAYAKALESLDRIENKDTRTKEAYQVVAFNQGVELFKAGNYTQAESFFSKVNTYPVNAALTAESMFWLAEIAYNEKAYTKATGLYNQFLKEPGGYQSPYYNEANYGAGYSLFNQRKYVSAASSFRKYVDQFKGDDMKRKNDALLRVGDCYYVNKQYDLAIEYYDRAIAEAQFNEDYAMYQKAICYGLKDDNGSEIATLKKIIDTQTDSKFTEAAKYQLGKSYLEANNPGEARFWFENILQEHPNSAYVKNSLLDLCLVYLKLGNNQKVVELWNQIKTTYPNDEVTIDAFNLVENILLEEGLMDELPDNLGLTDADIEKKIYNAAADFAISGDCATAISKLEEYLRKYQPGIYATPANYYIASCYFEQGNTEQALNSYNYVITQPVSDFTEESLIAAATINYNNRNYQQALNHYIELEGVASLEKNELEAQIGQMRCHYLLGQVDYALQYAEKVILNEGTPDEILTTAHLWKGRILQEQGKFDDAYYDYVEVVKRGGKQGAEAKFHMAEIAYAKEAYKAAETEIFELIENFSAYAEWKFKGFLLLSDVYIGLEDLFQARVTLETILDNVSESWVVMEAENKLQALEALENQETRGAEEPEEEIEIDLNEDNK